MLTALLAAAIFTQAAPAAAPSSTSSPAPAATPGDKTVSPLVITPEAKPPSASDIQKYVLVCHNETVLGSMFPKQVCATQAQFTERRNLDQQEVRRWQSLKTAGGSH
ncbi:hypothetical protein [Phenylobacterium sp.]|uniref:hypothetical protein n=1 Tax=Phenylobacterium sp. TaxID=1871053 RepID=UPI0012280904|nr:hypothetical protein [Phenylobacterium sp.]THD61539.1 MAG: hypothetical protein E8A49_11200 [Phenylobacterium sp.]